MSTQTYEKRSGLYLFIVEMFQEDETEMASVTVETPNNTKLDGGEYAIDMNEFCDARGYDHQLPERVYDRLVEFVESCRYKQF